MPAKKRRTTKRKSTTRRTRSTAQYEVAATFKLRSTPMSKSKADALARRARAKGASTVRIKKV